VLFGKAHLVVLIYLSISIWKVIVTAKVDFYAGFGQFQLNIIELSEFSDGFIKKEIERLKKEAI
jgi:hypothetical protein